MRELASSIQVRPSLAQATRNSEATGTAVDRAGFESVTFALVVGAYTDGEHTLVLEHSDEDGNYEPVSADDVVGEAVATVDDGSPAMPTLAGAAAVVGYTGGKRWVRPVVEVEGAGTGAVTSVVAILGHAHQRPTA